MVSLSQHTNTGPEDVVVKSPRERLDIIAAYRDLGSFRAAAALCGTTDKTVKHVVLRQQQGPPPPRAQRRHNTAAVVDVVREKVAATDGRISAKRLLPLVRAAGYTGSGRNLRRVVREIKDEWRRRRRVYRPWLPTPGEHLVIDWGQVGPLHIFSAVLVWSRIRFIRFALDERRATTLRLLAECFEEIGGVPAVVLADRMACLRAGVVANVVVPHPEYVRFASHFGFRPDFCEAHDPESKGVVENLVGYAKADLVIPGDPLASLAERNADAVQWCAEVNGRMHSETCAVPAERLELERDALRPLPSLRPPLRQGELRTVDRLATIRFGSARYSGPRALAAGARGAGAQRQRARLPGAWSRRRCVPARRRGRRDRASRQRARRDQLAGGGLRSRTSHRGDRTRDELPALPRIRCSCDPRGGRGRDDRSRPGCAARPRAPRGPDAAARGVRHQMSGAPVALAPDLERGLKRLKLRSASFPVHKSVEEFKVGESAVPRATFDYLASLEWIRAKENLVLVGPAGTGKSHLLIALGHAAVTSGLRVRYFAAVDLVEDLYRGLADNSVGRILDQLLRADLVICDELGFAPLDARGSQLLFRFVAAMYERRSLAIASHWPFEEWGSFFPETVTATSLLDRILHHATVVVTSGESFRMKEARSRPAPRAKALEPTSTAKVSKTTRGAGRCGPRSKARGSGHSAGR